MLGNKALFEYHYVYGNPKLHYVITDIHGKYIITPVVNNRSNNTTYYEVDKLFPLFEKVKFRSQKKAMQYVVAELFNEFFGYE